jgi:hypothetical protein
LWGIIVSCEDGDFDEFPFLKMHHSFDQHRVIELIADTLNLTYTDAVKKYSEWAKRVENPQP